MAGMIRKQLYISDDQERRLKRRAAVREQSEADIVRGYIDAGLAEDEVREAATEELWQRQLALMDDRAKLRVPHQVRSWRREDIYEERLSRYPDRH